MTDKETATMEKQEATHSMSEADEKGRDGSPDGSEFDLLAYHDHNAGRLVVDPE